jgi:parallel beta-helix repeat protein
MLQNNTMSGNSYNFGVDGYDLSEHIQNIDTSNTVDGKPIYYWIDKKNMEVPGNAGFVGVVNSTNITVRDIILTKNRDGVLFVYTENSKIENVTANSNSYGIELYYSSDNTLTGNTANSNDDCGIFLRYLNNNNTLTSNIANSNSKCGIFLYASSGNNITCNWVQNNTEQGFDLRNTGNNISYNNIIENGNYNTETCGWEWQLYNAQSNSIEIKHNYWGAGMNNSTIDASIYDDDESPYRGEVKFYPFETEPVPCAPGPERPAFTTADAAIALQIAVGSRPPAPRWDVSGDGSVTSLDALMILQAAADSNT